MNRIALYFLFILAYLAISNSFNPDKMGFLFLTNSFEIEKVVDKYPVTAILTDIQSKGVFFKSHYLRFRIVYGFSGHKEVIIRTNKDFADQNRQYVGMSIFRINSDGESSSVAQPPGFVFVGNTQFGKWKYRNGRSQWAFYRFYRHFPNLLGWSEFRPSKKFYREYQNAVANKAVFFGLKKEFGTEGSITQKNYQYKSEATNKYSGLAESIKRKMFKTTFGENSENI
jgi:hypothetical protein